MPSPDTDEVPAAPKDRKYPCGQCGADLVFAPGQAALKCPFCGHAEEIPETEAEIKEYSLKDHLSKPRSTGFKKDTAGRKDARCGGCGAVVQIEANLRATQCPFCASPLVLDDAKSGSGADDVITPEAVVPFKVTEKQASDSFRTWISTRWFAPNTLKEHHNAKGLSGVYRPYWTYDSDTVSHWSGERGDHYYVEERYTATENGQTVTKTRKVRKTRWTSVSGVYKEFFDDVLVKAGNNTDFTTNYNLKGLVPYTPDYLSGFAAEHYVVSVENGWTKAKSIIADAIRSAVRRRIGGDEQRIHSVDTAHRRITYKHVLLPLWLSCYKFGGKTYSFQVNGQTGEVQGARPYSFAKIALFVLAIVGVIAAIVLLASG